MGSNRWLSIAALGVFLILAIPGFAAADGDQSVKLGGKTLQLLTTAATRVQAKIDGRVIAEDAFLEVEASFSDGARGAAVLLISDGGNGCPGNYMVVAADAGGKVTATDPFGTCSDTAEASATDGTLTVRFAPIAGRDGATYRWSFAGGLAGPVPEAFQPKPGTNWSNANDLIGKYPWEALDNADVFAGFKAVLGEDFETFTEYFGKGDAMDATGDGIIVGDCWDDTTENSTAVLIGIDPAHRAVYVALQDGDDAPRLYPARDRWPASLREKLKQWP